MELIDLTLHAGPVVDFFRVMVGLLGVVVFLFALVRFLGHKLFWSAIGFMSVGLLTAFQEAEAVGGPRFVPWRLPLLALGNVAASVYLYRESDGNRK